MQTNFRLRIGQQVVFLHHPQNTLAVHHHAAMAKFCRDAPVSVTAMMLDGYLLNGCTDRRLFDARLPSSEASDRTQPG